MPNISTDVIDDRPITIRNSFLSETTHWCSILAEFCKGHPQIGNREMWHRELSQVSEGSLRIRTFLHFRGLEGSRKDGNAPRGLQNQELKSLLSEMIEIDAFIMKRAVALQWF